MTARKMLNPRLSSVFFRVMSGPSSDTAPPDRWQGDAGLSVPDSAPLPRMACSSAEITVISVLRLMNRR